MSRTVGASFDVISTTSPPRTVTTNGWAFPGDRARPRNVPIRGRFISLTIDIPSPLPERRCPFLLNAERRNSGTACYCIGDLACPRKQPSRGTHLAKRGPRDDQSKSRSTDLF